MLEVGKSPGKEPLIPQWAVERLKAELADPEGFTSYKEVKLWLEGLLDIKVKYDVVHHLVSLFCHSPKTFVISKC